MQRLPIQINKLEPDRYIVNCQNNLSVNEISELAYTVHYMQW